MDRGGTGLSSCASAWNGVAVISKKKRHHATTRRFPRMAPYGSRFPQINRNHGRAWALVGRATIVGESSGPTKDHGISVQQARRIAANIATTGATEQPATLSFMALGLTCWQILLSNKRARGNAFWLD